MRLKKTICVLTVLLILILSFGCSFHPYNIPDGYYSEDEHWDPVATQDTTSYCKYLYMNSDPVQQNSSYRMITEDDLPTIRGYVDNFRGWMETCERLDEFDFSMDSVDIGDYFAIESKYQDEPYWSYNLYIFDTKTSTLYFMHSNV